MPPKRDAAATPTQPPVKMIKIGSEAQEFGCDPMEDKYRLAEESSFSPFPNNEVRDSELNVYLKKQNKTVIVYITARRNCNVISSRFAARNH